MLYLVLVCNCVVFSIECGWFAFSIECNWFVFSADTHLRGGKAFNKPLIAVSRSKTITLQIEGLHDKVCTIPGSMQGL